MHMLPLHLSVAQDVGMLHPTLCWNGNASNMKLKIQLLGLSRATKFDLDWESKESAILSNLLIHLCLLCFVL